MSQYGNQDRDTHKYCERLLHRSEYSQFVHNLYRSIKYSDDSIIILRCQCQLYILPVLMNRANSARDAVISVRQTLIVSSYVSGARRSRVSWMDLHSPGDLIYEPNLPLIWIVDPCLGRKTY
jgi:hypothetical protein